MELLWKHHEQLLRVRLLQSFHQVVLEFVVQACELLFEVGPRQFLVVDEVDEHVECRLDVVSTRLVVATARVERCEQEVSIELVELLLGDVASIIIFESSGEAEVYQVEQVRIRVAH